MSKPSPEPEPNEDLLGALEQALGKSAAPQEDEDNSAVDAEKIDKLTKAATDKIILEALMGIEDRYSISIGRSNSSRMLQKQALLQQRLQQQRMAQEQQRHIPQQIKEQFVSRITLSTHNEIAYSRFGERVKRVEEILQEPSKAKLVGRFIYRISKVLLRSVFTWK